MEAFMLGSFERSRELIGRVYRSCGIGVYVLPLVLAAMIALAATQPNVSSWISEAAQAEFASSNLPLEIAPTAVAQSPKVLRTVKANCDANCR
jgi:hypothetical protein